MMATFSATYVPANPTSIGTTGQSPRYAGTPSTAAANAKRIMKEPAPIITLAAADFPENKDTVSAVDAKLTAAIATPYTSDIAAATP